MKLFRLGVIATFCLAACQSETPASASTESPPGAEHPIVAQPSMAEINEACTAQSRLAKGIMEARQGGVAMADQMKLMGEHEFHQQLVVLAYEQPRYATGRMQHRSTVDFENAIHLACVRERSRG